MTDEAKTAAKWVYDFSEGNAGMKPLLGGKGANLSEMTKMGLPVPPGFIVTTSACVEHMRLGRFPDGLWEQVVSAVHSLEAKTGKNFGDPARPLLFAVRSGAVFSMPGMMDTVLNLGLNDATAEGLLGATHDERFVLDTRRRFMQMFGDVVMGVEKKLFEAELCKVKRERSKRLGTDLSDFADSDVMKKVPDTALDASDLLAAVTAFNAVILKHAGKPIPADPYEQLRMAVEAVFKSWDNDRAKTYRRLNRIPDTLGTAVNVQSMVFGNMGPDSATGVGFTRDPSTGEKVLYGEYLVNAQGEDVVAGVRTPKQVKTLEAEMPEQFKALVAGYSLLEPHFRDMQDFEFTVEKGKFYMLQTRSGKRTPMAAVRVAVDMVKEGLIDERTAVMRVKPEDIEKVLHPQFEPVARKSAKVLGKGLPASPGAAAGRAAFDAKKAVEMKHAGEKVLLVRPETSPEDIAGMDAAEGILTSRGGMSSHAAVVARGMGKPAIVGAEFIRVDDEKRELHAGGAVYREGDWLSIDGGAGEVLEGKIETVQPRGLEGPVEVLLAWADKHRRMGVRANADIPRDAEAARRFGAEGIGLCRTEHMFFEPSRIDKVRLMILAKTTPEREKALAELLPLQKEDFKGLFRVMKGLPVTIRLIDPPLHEFLPKTEEDVSRLANLAGVSPGDVRDKAAALHESNPMLGHRGCRLTISYPEIAVMQVQAIIGAAIELKQEGIDAVPEIMVPLVGHVNEMRNQRDLIEKTADAMLKKAKVKMDYLVGTMIEVPRAAVTAREIAKEAEFFSFGTNDLTQMTFGFSRDDINKFLQETYLDKGILADDPFKTVDRDGVGALVKMGTREGRRGRRKLKVGVCGEHGGDPASIHLFEEAGLDYVSASPYRVPVARLAAAQAHMSQQDAQAKGSEKGSAQRTGTE